MSQYHFPVPVHEHELIDLLSAAGEPFCLFEKDGTGHGWLAAELREAGDAAQPSPQVQVYDGEKCVLQADTREEAVAFLHGVFLMAFSGRSLETIRLRAKQAEGLDGHVAYQEMRRLREP